MRRLAALLALEGALLVALGVVYAAVSCYGAKDRAAAELAAGAAVLAGAVLLVLARAAARGRGWSRSPAVVLNVFPFPIALGVVQAGDWWAALPLLGLAGSVLYLYATPELRELFRERGA